MKAIRIHAFGGPEVLQYVDVPTPTPLAGQVLVRLHATSVNPLERRMRAGLVQAFMPITLPFTPGSDFAGVVDSVGSGVTGFVPGQAVAGCVAATVGGAYAQYIVVPADVLVAKPESLDFDQAASFPIVSMTAWQALFVKADLQRGQSVLIHAGAGGVGMFAVQLAKWKGVRVFATASARDLDFVKSLGAERVFDYKADRFEDELSDVDVVFDLIGGDTQRRSWPVLKSGGILVGATAPPSQEDAARHGARAAMVQMKGDAGQLATIAGLFGSGDLVTSVGATFPLAQAGGAQKANETAHVRGKIVLQID